MNNCIAAENLKFFIQFLVCVSRATSCRGDITFTRAQVYLYTTAWVLAIYTSTHAPLRYATWGSLHVGLLGVWWLLRVFLGFVVESPADVSSDESDAVAVNRLFESDQQNTIAFTSMPSQRGELLGLSGYSSSA